MPSSEECPATCGSCGSCAQQRCELLRRESVRLGPLPEGSCADKETRDKCLKRRTFCTHESAPTTVNGPNVSTWSLMNGSSESSHRVQNYSEHIRQRCARTCRMCNASHVEHRWEQHHETTHRVCGSVRSPPGCTHYYVDTGANTGDSVIRWYQQPSCVYAGIRFPVYLRQDPPCYFLWPPWLQIENRRQYCAVAFEPNPRHWDSLQRTASKMQTSFGSNVTLSNSAFSNESAEASFGIDTVSGTG
jgi:hypothetical protein